MMILMQVTMETEHLQEEPHIEIKVAREGCLAPGLRQILERAGRVACHLAAGQHLRLRIGAQDGCDRAIARLRGFFVPRGVTFVPVVT